jgi:hypothetical protein
VRFSGHRFRIHRDALRAVATDCEHRLSNHSAMGELAAYLIDLSIGEPFPPSENLPVKARARAPQYGSHNLRSGLRWKMLPCAVSNTRHASIGDNIREIRHDLIEMQMLEQFEAGRRKAKKDTAKCPPDER